MLRAPTTMPANAETRGDILIVEDDAMVAAILQSRLKKMGYSAPHMIASGEKALEKVRESRPALVLMDIQLGGEMDGIEAARCIRQQFDIPVIYLTSHTDDSTLQRASSTEPFGYIVKPFEEGELRAVIEIAFYRHKADQQLRKMERWLTTTLRSIGDGVVATDTSGRITMLNPVAEAITGWKQAEAESKPFEEVFRAVNEKTRRPIKGLVSKSLLEGTAVNHEVNGLLIAKDGRELPVDTSAAPIRDDDGKVIGVVVVFRDSTERKRSETAVRQMNEQLEERVKQRTAQLEAVNRELEAFTYSVSHDMRGPIRSIDDFANAILEDYEKVLDEKGKKYLGFLCQNAQRMEKMVSDFLRLSHLGHSQLQLQKTDMSALVAEVISVRVQNPKQKSIKVDVKPLPVACCDQALIRQVWENLLSNAVKYSAGQSLPHIEIGGSVQGKEVIYSVRDNGVGFDPKNMGKLFRVFQRLHAPEEFEGNGVGLAIVQRIVLRHSGRVWAESETGKGATFYFSLPMEAN